MKLWNGGLGTLMGCAIACALLLSAAASVQAQKKKSDGFRFIDHIDKKQIEGGDFLQQSTGWGGQR